MYDPHKFRSYAAFQTYANYFRDNSLPFKRAVDQASLLNTKIPIWFATKDWNFLLSNLDCKVVIYEFVFCWLLFHAKFNCNYFQSCVPYIYCGI